MRTAVAVAAVVGTIAVAAAVVAAVFDAVAIAATAHAALRLQQCQQP